MQLLVLWVGRVSLKASLNVPYLDFKNANWELGRWESLSSGGLVYTGRDVRWSPGACWLGSLSYLLSSGPMRDSSLTKLGE